jgi:hypothetical protein
MVVKKYFTKDVMEKLNNSQKWAILSLMKTNKKWSTLQNKLFNDILEKNNLNFK